MIETEMENYFVLSIDCMMHIRSLMKISSELESREYFLEKQTEESKKQELIQFQKKFTKIIKNFKEYLKDDKEYFKLAESEYDDLIFRLDQMINSLNDMSRINHSSTIFYINMILDASHNLFSHLIDILRHKINFYQEIEMSKSFELISDLQKFKKIYESLGNKLINDIGKRYLEAAIIDLDGVVLELDEAYRRNISFVNREIIKTDLVKTHLISALYRISSSFEKIIYVLNFEFNLDIGEEELNITKVIKALKEKDLTVFAKIIEESDRKEIISIGRSLRNSNMHRLSTSTNLELEGYISSYVREIVRIIESFEKEIPNK